MATIEPYTTSTGLKRYRVRYRTPDHKQTDKRGFTTKRDAELFRASLAVSMARGEYVPARAGRVTVGELAGRWIAHTVTQKPSTMAATEGALRTHVLPKWRDVYAADISHTDVKSWVARLSAERGPATVHRAHNVLSMILEDAVRDGRLAKNPAAGVPLPRTSRKARVYLTHQQVAALASASGEFRLVVLFLAYTGLRWGEMAALRAGRVDLLRRRVEVVENVVDVGGRLEWGTPKTYESRSVPFPRFLSGPLTQAVAGKSADDLLFTGANGGTLRHNVVRRRHFAPAVAVAGTAVRELQTALLLPEGARDGVYSMTTESAVRAFQAFSGLDTTGRADAPTWIALADSRSEDRLRAFAHVELAPGARDFPRLTPHDLRHTAASLAVSAGANVKAVQRMLGHASAAMTLDTYADLFDDDLDTVADALDAAASEQDVGKLWARESRS